MSELILVDYHDAERAGEVLAALKQEHPEWRANFADAAVLVKHADETVRLARPAEASMSGEAAEAASKPLTSEEWQQQMGLSGDFLFQAQRLIRPGDSALLLLVRAGDPEQVMDAMQPYGGRVLHTSLTSRQAEQFQSGSASGSVAWA